MHDVVAMDGTAQGKHQQGVVHGTCSHGEGVHGNARLPQLVEEGGRRTVEEQQRHLVTAVAKPRQQVDEQVLRPAGAQGGDDVEDSHGVIFVKGV